MNIKLYSLASITKEKTKSYPTPKESNHVQGERHSYAREIWSERLNLPTAKTMNPPLYICITCVRTKEITECYWPLFDVCGFRIRTIARRRTRANDNYQAYRMTELCCWDALIATDWPKSIQKRKWGEKNFHKYSLGLGGGLFRSDLSAAVLSAAPLIESRSSVHSSICVVSVASDGLIGCVASGARGAAPLLRDLLRRLRRISGPKALESSPRDVEACASRSSSSLLTSRDAANLSVSLCRSDDDWWWWWWWWWCSWLFDMRSVAVDCSR